MTKRPGLAFMLWWASAQAATEFAIVVIASLLLPTTWPWVALCAMIEGALLGLIQGWLLQGKPGRFILDWTLATIAGVLAGRLIQFGTDISPLAVAILGLPLPMHILAVAALGGAIGAAVGLAQAPLLRDKVSHPRHWIALCSVAWALTLPTLLLVGVATERLSALPLWYGALTILALFGANGAITGAIEGAGLTWMLRTAGRRAPTRRRGQSTIEAAI